MLIILIVLISYGPGKQSRCSSVNNGDSGGVQVYERCVWGFFMKMLTDKNDDWRNTWRYFAWSIIQVLTVLSLIFSDFDNIFFNFHWFIKYFLWFSPQFLCFSKGSCGAAWSIFHVVTLPPLLLFTAFPDPSRPPGLKTMRHCGESEIRNPI